MEHPGLGDLGKLPREVRDIVYSMLFPVIPSSLFSPGTSSIPNHNTRKLRRLLRSGHMKTSKQLYRENLEAFLSKHELEGSSHPRKAIPNLKDLILPDVPAASFVKGLGYRVYATSKTSMTFRKFEISGNKDFDRDVSRGLNLLWNQGKEEQNVPTDRLFLTIDYGCPVWFLFDRINRRGHQYHVHLEGETPSIIVKLFPANAEKSKMALEKAGADMTKALKHVRARIRGTHYGRGVEENELTGEEERVFKAMLEDGIAKLLRLWKRACKRQVAVYEAAAQMWRIRDGQYDLGDLFGED